MQKLLISSLVILIVITVFAQNESAYKNPALPVNDRINDLLSRMTLEEKIGQMMQFFHTSLNEQVFADVQNGIVGSILGSRTKMVPVSDLNKIQKVAVTKTRLGIPLLFDMDVNHGFKTIFPNGNERF
ncbi:hypothetical protein JW935_17815 [candidate division KSB1 bacterium]|nr:hypothetical protein [candidate division KSB1 bacterium]